MIVREAAYFVVPNCPYHSILPSFVTQSLLQHEYHCKPQLGYIRPAACTAWAFDWEHSQPVGPLHSAVAAVVAVVAVVVAADAAADAAVDAAVGAAVSFDRGVDALRTVVAGTVAGTVVGAVVGVAAVMRYDIASVAAFASAAAFASDASAAAFVIAVPDKCCSAYSFAGADADFQNYYHHYSSWLY